MKNQIKNYLKIITSTIKDFDHEEVEVCCKVLLRAYKEDRNIFVCGNGGSAATASHFACDINKGVSNGLDKKFRIIALTDNIPLITAYSNDNHYDDIFIKQLKNFYVKGDLIIGISGSAVEYVNKNKGISIGWTGYKGGKLKEIVHHSVNANVMDMQISEDMHMILVHIVMKVLRKSLTGSEDYT
jgi:D-sedoheptulose 7-phosphate isomerase